MIKKAKVATATETDTPVLRNSYLDGIDPIIRSRSTGLRSLRIDRNTAGTQNPTTPATSPLTVQPASSTADATQAAQLKIIRGLFGNKIGT
ncbi:hypothetical protein DMC25_06430 [Caulobacter sp. D4A]|nr:hypothetical protein DMC25_06430 [Caulobacter sp. D4A]PXA96793.1 hypothetical protein DMC18_00590 [Caulobacter sp. D5]